MKLLPFLSPQAVCQNQLLNNFFYDIAISRVVICIKLPENHYLTYWNGGNLANKVLQYNQMWRGIKVIDTTIAM